MIVMAASWLYLFLVFWLFKVGCHVYVVLQLGNEIFVTMVLLLSSDGMTLRS